MKNFFQRKQDAQPNPRLNNPANDPYKIWLPPTDPSRATAPGPTAWTQTTAQTSARRGGETHRSSSRAPGADASSVPTSATYKYATGPNNTGFYYSNNPAQPVQPFPSQYPPQYYPSALPRPPPGSFDRPDSRLGYVPYPYQNPQYPQTFAAPPPLQPAASQAAAPKRQEDKTRNTVEGRGPNTVSAPVPAPGRPASSRKYREKDDEYRAPRKPPSSSSIREQKREDEVKKPKHRPREPSETRKRRDSQVEDPYTEKYRDKSGRKESKRDGKSRADARAEEGDSSDSSIWRPSSSAGHRLRHEGKSALMMNNPQQGPTQFSAPLRTALPIQPTAASSSSGKHTPQIPRMPVYLPANHGRSQRPDEGQTGQSESDTDHGTLNRGRNFLRGTVLPNAKQQTKSNNVGGPSTLTTTINKKVKESKGLWPFSRSKSSQKLPPNIPNPALGIPNKKIRVDSTPSRFPQVPIDGWPEYHRHASDNAITGHPDRQAVTVPQESRLSQPEAQPSGSRASFFQSNDSSSRPITTVSQQAPLNSFQSRSAEAPSAPNPGAQSIVHPPVPIATSSSSRSNPVPQPGIQHGQFSSLPPGPNQIQRPETPLRRDGRDTSILPPIYAPPVVARTSDYPRVPDRSTTPKVSHLVAGFEARSSETQAHIPQQAAKSPPIAARREILENPSLSRIYAPPQQSSQGPGNTSTSARASTSNNPYSSASQPPYSAASQPPPRQRTTSDVSIRPVIETSFPARPAINQPDVLKTQLRDLLTDKPTASRNDEKAQPRKAPESRNNQAPPAVYPNLTSSQSHAFIQPPVQVYTAGTSSTPFKSAPRSEKPAEVPPLSNPLSRRPDASQSNSADRTSRVGASRTGDEVRDVAHGRPSRSKKDVIAVMKTPSKDSSRHTSSPSPVLVAHSTHQSSQPQSAASQPPTSRSQLPPSSSVVPGDRTSQRDHRPPSTAKQHPRDPLPSTTSNAPTSSFNERGRPAPSPSTLPFPSNQPISVPYNIPPSGRTTVPTSGPTPKAELLSSGPQSGSRPTGSSSSNPRGVPRVPSEESILKTPSSLAHSVLQPLQPSISRTSIPASVSSETRKKGIFGMFRPKETQQAETDSFEGRYIAPSTRVPDRGPQSSLESIANPRTKSDRKFKSKAPPPITVPNPAVPISDRKSPNSRVFTPFRYLSSKRNRRVSTASMDAVNGTAPNTVMGSPTASMQSSQMPVQSPPQRDPHVATQDWRNQEESEARARGKPRRVRPGVVFDVAEDPLEETKRSRPARVKKAQPQAEPQTTDSSDG